MYRDVYLYDGLRSAFGRHGGELSGVRPDQLLAQVIQALVARNAFELACYEEVIAGNANQSGEEARNVARFSALMAGLPVSSSAVTVNRLCGSALSAAVDAARMIALGEAKLTVVAGVESMSRAPWVMSKSETAFGRNQQLVDTTIGSRFTHPEFAAEYGDHSMAQTADNVAELCGISREACDRFALASQQRYASARARNFFAGEIQPIPVAAGRRGESRVIDCDEHPRETSLERLSALRPLNSGGVVTAGNASGINDGAAALLVGNRAVGERYQQRPRARVVASAAAGVEPRLMGLGPVPAIEKVLARAQLTLSDLDVIEINEAFAAQVLGCLHQLGLDPQDSRVNANGGAIAVGHPLGASGARLLLTAMAQLEATGGRYALVSLCIGVGQGIAMLIERQVDC